MKSAPFLVLALLAAQPARADLRPAEMPPPGYAERSYTDSRGCLFQRAVVNGATSWIAVTDVTGAALCNGAVPAAAASAAPAPVAAAPDATPAPLEVPTPAATAAAATAKAPAAAPVAVTAAAKAAEPATAATGTAPRYWVQVGAFAVPDNADAAADRLRGAGHGVARLAVRKGRLTAILAGPFAARAEAETVAGALDGAGWPGAFVRP